jgi:hypothetical protein
VVIPTKMDVDEDDPGSRAAAMAVLGLSAEDEGVNLRLSQGFVRGMAERGIPCVDPTEAMRAGTVALLLALRLPPPDVSGHALVAQQLFETLAPLLAAREAPR